MIMYGWMGDIWSVSVRISTSCRGFGLLLFPKECPLSGVSGCRDLATALLRVVAYFAPKVYRQMECYVRPTFNSFHQDALENVPVFDLIGVCEASESGCWSI
jgi:hypothetical protein